MVRAEGWRLAVLAVGLLFGALAAIVATWGME